MTQGVLPPEDRSAQLAQRGRYPWLSSTAIVVAISALALCLRLVAIKFIGPDPGVAGYSESNVIASNLVWGKGYTFDFYGWRPDQPLRSFIPPLYVGLVYACLRWADNPALALALAQAVLSTLVCSATYIIALKLSKKQSAAILAALAAACYPVLILQVNVPQSLILHTAVLLWAVAVTVLLPGRLRWGWAVLGGILWGLIALGRPAMLGFMPVVVFWLWLNRTDRRGWLTTSVVLATAVILVVLPWTIRNYRIHGQIVMISTNGGFNFWNGNNPFTTGSSHLVYTERVDQFLGLPPDPEQPAVVQVSPYPLPPEIQTSVATVSEVTLDRQLYQAGLDFIRQHPREWITLVGKKLISFWWFRPGLSAASDVSWSRYPKLTYWYQPGLGPAYESSWTAYYKLMYALLMVVFAAGLAISFKYLRRYSLLYLLFGYYTVTNVAYHTLTRFRWEIEPLFLVFAALCVSVVAEQLSAAHRIASNLAATKGR
jgi:4-amino-4-deoxy-L-arabinose transferase-like glycosyltransferase